MSNFDVLPPLLGEDLRELVDVSCGVRQRSKLKPSTKRVSKSDDEMEGSNEDE